MNYVRFIPLSAGAQLSQSRQGEVASRQDEAVYQRVQGKVQKDIGLTQQAVGEAAEATGTFQTPPWQMCKSSGYDNPLAVNGPDLL
jgi:hypothetical protein